ncbi:MAG: ABC transporter permease [Acidobacteriaceae bacterium]|nr:ABC transporter permease [Acidobacteriaceae bacterium]MBV9308188.1 ABC transporter permease [Acidobacteriaceae bacterium]
MRFLLRRAMHTLLILVGASLVSFSLVNLAPGDFFDQMKVNPRISQDTLTSLRSQYGLDRPLPVRYLQWVRSVINGQWGFSFAYNSPAGPILWSRSSKTLLLTGVATLLAWSLALPLGGWAGARPGSSIDWLTRGTVAVLLATPELVLALLLLLFAVRTGYFPAGGLTSSEYVPSGLWDQTKDVTRHVFLPSICLAAGLLPLLLTHIRTAVSEAFESPYIEAARGHGIPFRRLLLRHVLPLAANPLISLFGLSLGMMISSSLLIEAVFSWPGLGQLMLEAIQQRDFYLVVDTAVLSTAFLIVGNLIADVLLYASDPRIRTE